MKDLIGFLGDSSKKIFVDHPEPGKCAARNNIITIVFASHALLIYGHTSYRRAHANKQARGTPWASQEFRMFGALWMAFLPTQDTALCATDQKQKTSKTSQHFQYFSHHVTQRN